MKNHTKIYINFFKIIEQDFLTCEWCNMEQAVDIHHLVPRGGGGSKTKDYIDNLIGLCRNCHNRAEFVTEPYLRREELQAKHLKNMKVFTNTGRMWYD